eukprot:685451-Rhodomonas_salina.3
MGKKAQNPEGGNVEAGALAEVANEPGQARYKTDPEAIPEAIAVDEQPMESRSSSKNLNKAHSKGSKRDAPVPQAVRMDSTIPLAQPYEGGGYGNQPTAIPQHMVQVRKRRQAFTSGGDECELELNSVAPLCCISAIWGSSLSTLRIAPPRGLAAAISWRTDGAALVGCVRRLRARVATESAWYL